MSLLSLNTLQQLPSGHQTLSTLFINIQSRKKVFSQHSSNIFQRRLGRTIHWDRSACPTVMTTRFSEVFHHFLKDLPCPAFGMHSPKRHDQVILVDAAHKRPGYFFETNEKI